jgi:hypothetical protein
MTTIREYQEQTGHSVHSAENQRILEKFVSRNVERNVSRLVEHFLRNPEALNGSDYDWEELFDLGKRIDWEEAVNDTTKAMDWNDCKEYLEERGFEVRDEETVDELREAVYQDVMCEDMKYWQDFIEDQDIVDLAEYEMEALEFWIVDERFREKLAEKGEATMEEFFGMPVWGRTTSGQGIAMDAIVAEIALDIGILVGQENEWRL